MDRRRGSAGVVDPSRAKSERAPDRFDRPLRTCQLPVRRRQRVRGQLGRPPLRRASPSRRRHAGTPGHPSSRRPSGLRRVQSQRSWRQRDLADHRRRRQVLLRPPQRVGGREQGCRPRRGSRLRREHGQRYGRSPAHREPSRRTASKSLPGDRRGMHTASTVLWVTLAVQALKSSKERRVDGVLPLVALTCRACRPVGPCPTWHRCPSDATACAAGERRRALGNRIPGP